MGNHQPIEDKTLLRVKIFKKFIICCIILTERHHAVLFVCSAEP